MIRQWYLIAFISILLSLTPLSSQAELNIDPPPVESSLPAEFKSRLRPPEQSLAAWYIRNEAINVLTMGGILLSTGLTSYMAPRKLPLGLIMTGASLAIDTMTSHDWIDFSIRQGVKFSLAIFSPFKANTLLSNLGKRLILRHLLIETPNILQGFREYSYQRQPFYQGVVEVKASDEYSSLPLQLFYSTEPTPALTIASATQESFQCFPIASDILQARLNNLLCSALTQGFTSLSLLPEPKEGNTQHLKVLARNASTINQLTIEITGQGQITTWITDALQNNKPYTGETELLNPLAPAIVKSIIQFLESGQPRAYCSIPDDENIKVTAIGGHTLQVTPLGSEGYFLIDHGRSQGTGKPDIWLNTTLSANEISEQWLSNVERRLAPNPGKGLWRLASSLKSATYRALLEYGMAWFHQKITEDKNKLKEDIEEESDTDDGQDIEEEDDISQIEEPDDDSEYSSSEEEDAASESEYENISSEDEGETISSGSEDADTDSESGSEAEDELPARNSTRPRRHSVSELVIDPENITTSHYVGNNYFNDVDLEDELNSISDTTEKVIVVTEDRAPSSQNARAVIIEYLLSGERLSSSSENLPISPDPIKTHLHQLNGEEVKIVEINPVWIPNQQWKKLRILQKAWIEKADKIVAILDTENLENALDNEQAFLEETAHSNARLNRSSLRCYSEVSKWLKEIMSDQTEAVSKVFYFSPYWSWRHDDSRQLLLPAHWSIGRGNNVRLWLEDNSDWRSGIMDFLGQ